MTHSQPGDRVALVLPPGLEFVQAFLACLRAGCVAVPICPPSAGRAPAVQSAIIADCEPVVGITNGALQALLLAENRPDGAESVSWVQLEEMEAATNESEVDVFGRERIPSSTAVAMLQYTSGSTGVPRGVMLTHANLVANSKVIQECFRYDSDTRALVWLPPYHDMGLIGGILQPLMAGFQIALMSPLHVLQRPLLWLKAISAQQITISGGPILCLSVACVRSVRRICAGSISVAGKLRSVELSRFGNPCCVSLPRSSRYVALTTERFCHATDWLSRH